MPIAAALPIAKFAAPLILKGLGKFFGNKGKKKALKAQQASEQLAIDNKFKSDSDAFENSEDDRLARTQGIANQLQGARALSPEVIAAAMKRRRNTAYKGAVQDRTAGMGSEMVGGALSGLGDVAGAMLREKAIAQAEGMSPQYSGRSTGFDTSNCPNGGDEGGCY